MSLLDMIKPKELPETKETAKKEVKPKEVVESETKPQDDKNGKTSSPKKDSNVKSTSKNYKYPFEIYLAAEKRDVSHIFEEGKEYTGREISKAMLEHGFFEFSGNVTYDFIEKENVLVPVFQQHKKG